MEQICKVNKRAVNDQEVTVNVEKVEFVSEYLSLLVFWKLV
jgi:hypothetical protein